MPLASPLLIAPPVPAPAALPENVEPATVRAPVPPLSPLSMAPPLWAPVLFPEKVELVSRDCARAVVVAAVYGPAVGVGVVPRKSRPS